RTRFELRCYIFIARNLLASDKSGLSDPLARVLIKEHVLQTQPLYQTMSPMWDVMLHKQLVFYYDAESAKQNHQQLVVEIFDVDPGDEMEFLGRCFCEVQVWIDGDHYKPPGLQWWPVYRGQTPAGELLAAFDLIQLDTKLPFEGIPTFNEIAAYTKDFDNRVILKSIPGMVLDDEDDLNRDSSEDEFESDFEDDEDYFDVDTIISASKPRMSQSRRRKKTVKLGLAPPQLAIIRREEDYRIPDSIRPPLHRFRCEVMFWSMFGMARQQLLPVKRPKVTIEIGGTKIESEIMRNLTKRRLFKHHLKVIDVYPGRRTLLAPMVMNCHDNRPFGTKVTVGSYTFSNIREYLVLDKGQSVEVLSLLTHCEKL
ncbi:hypothetical protein AHF37_10114, partial [Paragonimus kellicotti]